MKLIITIWVVIGVFAASQTYAATYRIDSNQSYLEASYLTWVKGDPVSLVDASTGESIFLGYSWEQAAIAQRFSLDGAFDMVVPPELVINDWIPISFEHVVLHTNAPEAINFVLPDYLGLEVSTGAIAKYIRLCPPNNGAFTSCFSSSSYEYDISSASGVRTANAVNLDGLAITSNIAMPLISIFSLTPPSDPILLTSAVTYHVVAQAVPEPENGILIMAGLGIIGFLARQRRLPRAD